METDSYYIQLAIDYLGSAIRDNTRNEKIAIGKMIDDGTWDYLTYHNCFDRMIVTEETI